jgi:2-polyprenyl-3-methyl-5-hydroxy-6-metoxy-1,4-benzoquinol methylase
METIRPFVDFYRQLGNEVVSRDYGDPQSMEASRQFLFLTLGVPPSLLKGKAILEFGPGAGHYARFCAQAGPSLYTLVEGVAHILEAAKANLIQHHDQVGHFEFIHSLFEEFNTSQKYDLVVAEACIPHQKDPSSLLRHMSDFVIPGGVIILTTISGTSYLSEIVRRLARDIILDPAEPAETQLAALTPRFKGHLEALPGIGRSVEDWVLDSIIQPLNLTKLFSIPDAINAVGDRFVAYGSSPRFAQDWAWHRTVSSPRTHINQKFIASYLKKNLNLLDCNSEEVAHDQKLGEEIEKACNRLWTSMCMLETKNTTSWAEVDICLEEIAYLIPSSYGKTKIALREAIDWIKDGAPLGVTLRHFPGWWGRGQQHMSFVKQTSDLL